MMPHNLPTLPAPKWVLERTESLLHPLDHVGYRVWSIPGRDRYGIRTWIHTSCPDTGRPITQHSGTWKCNGDRLRSAIFEAVCSALCHEITHCLRFEGVAVFDEHEATAQKENECPPPPKGDE